MSADFFISYTHTDQEWAEWIAWQLESVYCTTIYQARDFPPGSNFVLRMDVASKSERTIAVISPEYFTSEYTPSEWAAAFNRDPKGEKGTLVPVRVGRVEPEGIFSNIVYIDLVELEEGAARNTLLNGLRLDRVPKTHREFPGAVTSTAKKPEFPGAVTSTEERPEFCSISSALLTPPQLPNPAQIPEIRIAFPRQLLGTAEANIFINVELRSTSSAKLTFEFRRETDDLLIGNDPSSDDKFQFVVEPGRKFARAIPLRARRPIEGNCRVEVICLGEYGRVLTRNAFNVRFRNLPFWQSLFLVLISWTRELRHSHPGFALIVCAVVITIGGYMGIDWWLTYRDNWSLEKNLGTALEKFSGKIADRELSSEALVIHSARPVLFRITPPHKMRTFRLHFQVQLTKGQKEFSWIIRSDGSGRNYYKLTLTLGESSNLIAQAVRDGVPGDAICVRHDLGFPRPCDSNQNLDVYLTGSKCTFNLDFEMSPPSAATAESLPFQVSQSCISAGVSTKTPVQTTLNAGTCDSGTFGFLNAVMTHLYLCSKPPTDATAGDEADCNR